MKFYAFIIASMVFMTTSSMTGFTHTYLITPDKKPTPPLCALLSICGIHHDGSLENIIALTQKEQPHGFIRPADKERWEVISYLTTQHDAIIEQCTALHMFHEIKPSNTHYDYAILFGGITQSVRARVAFLAQLWHEGIRWKKLIVLTGQRPLDPDLESVTILTNTKNGILSIKTNWYLKDQPKMETDMIRMVLEQSLLPIEWQSIPTTFIDAPQQKRNNQLVRPNTIDTVQQWIITNPIPGSVLAIALQPMVGYQDAVLKRFLPSSFTIDTVGPVAVDPIKPEILIGTIGWWLYNAYYLY